MVAHGGVDPGYRAQMLRFASEKLIVVVLGNDPFYDVEGSPNKSRTSICLRAPARALL
jgi:hypothetical protein